MNTVSRGNRYLATTWLALLGGYTAICLVVPAGAARTAAANITLCLMPVLVNGALLINAVTLDWRKKAFWMFLALGSSLWLAGQAIWTYLEMYGHQHTPYVFNGYHFNVDIIFYLNAIPMIAALALEPHLRRNNRKAAYGYVDFGLILCWSLYLYALAVIPWEYVIADSKQYVRTFSAISFLQNIVFVGGAIYLFTQVGGYWRKTYAHLAGARAIYVARLLAIQLVAGRGTYLRGSLYDLPLLVSFLWLGTAGVLAYRHREEDTISPLQPVTGPSSETKSADDTHWVSVLSRVALLSLPVIGFWCMKLSHAPAAVREFRVLVTLGAIFPLGILTFLRHQLVDRDRVALLRASQDSIDNLKRLQMQFVQSEKLASIGQLVGGAAHEINNPLTAILGYSELLADDPTVGEKTRNLAEKIREQARRTTGLVNNLLSFARQSPSEQRATLDVNTIINTSAQFRRFDLRGKNIRIEVQPGSGIPEVRADMNQLLQVFSNIINNAVYAMRESGGGTLTVRTLFENGNVVILFSDTGPGMRDPHLVFDPFYTTKPVGKGTGLGLSICYGLIQDHGGHISCYNRPEGGATFRIELPAVPAAFPFSPRSVTLPSRSNPAKLA